MCVETGKFFPFMAHIGLVDFYREPLLTRGLNKKKPVKVSIDY
jgi:hypothetical protein